MSRIGAGAAAERRRARMRAAAGFAAVIVAAAVVGAPAGVRAELEWSGLADFVVRDPSEEDATNRTFRGTSNLDTFRVRLFADAAVADDVDLFAQLLLSGFNDAFINAAYLRFREIGGSPVNVQMGLIPGTIGTWAERTYSDKNPLVGVPLAYNHHSVLDPRDSVQGTVEDLLVQRAVRNRKGLPVHYENCWNTGFEAYGAAGALDWSVGVLAGSTSLPTRSQEEKLPQGTARLAWYAGPGLQVGVNGWAGPYLFEDAQVTWEPGKDNDDYLNGGFGYDLHASFRYLELHSELYRTFWEHPQLPTLRATAGYLEAKHKLRPRWYAAARFDFFEPDRVQDSSGAKRRWDYPVHRVEYGVGFRPRPRVVAKAVVQSNRFDGNAGLDEDHYILQVSAGF
jgi:hypothetical protein